jgi:RNA ligase (TIGR02306 family)
MQTSTEEVLAVAAVEIPAEPAPTVAVIGIIMSAEPIEGADRIHLVAVDCADSGAWEGVVPKDMGVGEKCLVLLQDALLPADPDHPRWGFMRSHKFRVRMARFKGVPSECVILPAMGEELDEPVGADVGLALGITKYSKPLPAEMAGVAKDNFPSFIPKTDETNFQRVRDLARQMADSEWYVTEKADGTSCTVFMDWDEDLRVCSRNWEIEPGDSLYWRMVEKYDVLRAMPAGVAVQFEIVGPGVQGNPMGLEENEIRVFGAHTFGPAGQRGWRVPYETLRNMCHGNNLPMAKLIRLGSGPMTADELRALAEIKYDNGKPGEGVVVTAMDSSWSFKVISLSYKD